jgi:hypothetical protein
VFVRFTPIQTQNCPGESTHPESLGQVHPGSGATQVELTLGRLSLTIYSAFARQNKVTTLNQERWFISSGHLPKTQNVMDDGESHHSRELHSTYEDLALLPPGSWIKCYSPLPVGDEARHFQLQATAYYPDGDGYRREEDQRVVLSLDSCNKFKRISRMIWYCEIPNGLQPAAFEFTPQDKSEELKGITITPNTHCYYGGTSCNHCA